MTKRKEKKYFKPVGIKDGSIYFLDYIFEDGDFKGAVGTVLYPFQVEAGAADIYADNGALTLFISINK
jgi:hypothetical protein